MKKTHRRPTFGNFRRHLVQLSAIAVFGMAASAHAEWALNNDASSLNFVTTKAVDISEIQGFDRLTGTVSKDGKAELRIDLTSINTGIPIRDERMSSFLFETERFAEARLNTQVPLANLAKLKAGESTDLDLQGTLSLHGFEIPITSPVQVVKLKNGSLQVNSTAPVIVNGRDVGLIAGIEKLRELAGLPSIGQSVSVTFQLNFSR